MARAKALLTSLAVVLVLVLGAGPAAALSDGFRDTLERHAAGGSRAGVDRTARPSESPADARALAEIGAALDGKKVTIRMREATLLDALEFIADVSALNLALSPEAREKAAERKTAASLKDVSPRSALAILLEGSGLAFGVRHGALWIDVASAFPSESVLRFYDVSDLVRDEPDFPAPSLALPRAAP